MRSRHGSWLTRLTFFGVCGVAGALATDAAEGQAAACRVVDVQITPSANLQIVVWLEDGNGNFVDTLFITQTTGTYGLGNRPGIMQFNSEYLWPYGRRSTLFPIWAHHRGVTYPKVVFQDGQDRMSLSHAFGVSSLEPHLLPAARGQLRHALRPDGEGDALPLARCRELRHDRVHRQGDLRDRQHLGGRGLLLLSAAPGRDPAGHGRQRRRRQVRRPERSRRGLAGHPARARCGSFTIHYSVPATLAQGDYVIWAEAAKEFDQNSSYDYPSPTLAAYGEYGMAYRGQPSVVWQVPISIDTTDHSAITLDYAGYGDPDGVDGNLRAPDDTISSTVEGSGAQRLLVSMADEGMYRVRVDTKPSDDGLPPDPPEPRDRATPRASTSATLAASTSPPMSRRTGERQRLRGPLSPPGSAAHRRQLLDPRPAGQQANVTINPGDAGRCARRSTWPNLPAADALLDRHRRR